MKTGSEICLFDLPDLRGSDFTAHNAQSEALWQAFAKGEHLRIPVRFCTNPRMLLLDPKYNIRQISFEQYMTDPEVMAQTRLEFLYWMRHLLPGDHVKGVPDEWVVDIEFQNMYDMVWFGCPVHYRINQVPDTTPILDDDRKRMLFDRGIPDPFQGEWVDRYLNHRGYLERKVAEGWTFLGKPVKLSTHSPFSGTDGVFTAACGLRGCTQLCLDLLMDPEYAIQLLEFVHTAIIERMKAWWKHFNLPYPVKNSGTADDSVEMLSVDQYREFVLPLHRKLFDTFGLPATSGNDNTRAIHLCGNAQRLFPVLKQELGITLFDTGFPVDFARFREEMGPECLISGGPAVGFFVQDTPTACVAEAERILRSGVLRGGKFILQEGNNLPPCASLDTCERVYETGKRLGVRADWW